jgi:hypothetical protein
MICVSLSNRERVKTSRSTLPVSDASTEECEVMPATHAVGIGALSENLRRCSVLSLQVLHIFVLDLRIRACDGGRSCVLKLL